MSQEIVHVIEGIVLGRPTCQLDLYGDRRECSGDVERTVNPFAEDVYGDTEEIDVCAGHLDGMHADV